jgi:hypothetical protein
MASTMFSKMERRTEIHLEENGERGWMEKPTGSLVLKHQRSDVSLEWV